jgi:diamine N-acetyltransferase
MNVEPGRVSLREVTGKTVIAITRLAVDKSQDGFVAPNAISFRAGAVRARGLVPGDLPRRHAGRLRDARGPDAERAAARRPADQPLALHDRRALPAPGHRSGRPRPGHRRSRRRKRFTSLETSYVPGPGCPEPFYLGLGFRHAGRLDGREVVLELPLDEPAR